MSYCKIAFLSLLAFSFALLAETTEDSYTPAQLKVKKEKFLKEIRLLEDKANRLQFDKKNVQEARELYEQISFLQMQIEEIDLKLQGKSND